MMSAAWPSSDSGSQPTRAVRPLERGKELVQPVSQLGELGCGEGQSGEAGIEADAPADGYREVGGSDVRESPQ
ncbi:hypothetical protein EAO71_25630 [Streptomyces sp. ms191]|nr:hypothetical protein EAO71_25630 [Streptomyces sp. ms191]